MEIDNVTKEIMCSMNKEKEKETLFPLRHQETRKTQLKTCTVPHKILIKSHKKAKLQMGNLDVHM